MPKFPHVTVKLTGTDGNAFAILGRVRRDMKSAGVSEEEISQFSEEATSGDYNNLLRTCMKWVDVQ